MPLPPPPPPLSTIRKKESNFTSSKKISYSKTIDIFPQARSIDKNIFISDQNQLLTDKAIAFGGVATKKFRQSAMDKQIGMGAWYKSRIGENGKRWNGICKALSILWIGYHATNKDFWGWLMQGADEIDSIPAATVCNLQAAYRGESNAQFQTPDEMDVMDNEEWTENIFNNMGLSQLRDIVSCTLIAQAKRLSGDSNSHVKQMISEMKKYKNRYQQLSFRGHGSSHAVALWVGRDVTLFDANHGEFWFPSIGSFELWFQFYWANVYSQKYNHDFSLAYWDKKW
ncbi:YopT-type cysteine protease domain-containing protein [Pelagibaculum spongiae]|uniref:Peptidase C58 YopT-type domain-containing protein n=1 Tax=Pelagibaculum spongiae TaxID=2080658 RepID=A0A2V1GVV6_9GAMM|nr:YopT-type cysteine protease domain-containing protein [Pelagibaculum spongiae]PVZ67787.1 hypothetical protein DC094_15250 [Pelagibaculum spongiae]